MKQNILIIGASGLVGGTLYKEALNQGHSVLGTYYEHKQADLEKLDYGDVVEIEKIISKFPCDFIFCPAGKVNVDWIEQNPEEAYKINVEKLKVLFEAAKMKKIQVVFFSTDYIFDGKGGPYFEDDTPNPINFYGKHKLEAENMAKKIFSENCLILRTTWVFGCEMQEKNFMYSVIKNLKANKEMKVPDDMTATPSYVKDLAKCALDLAKRKIYGTYNLTGGKVISRYNFAKIIAKAFDLNSSLLIPVKYSSMQLPASRPLVGGLKNDKITRLINYKWTSLEDSLREVKKEIKYEYSGNHT